MVKLGLAAAIIIAIVAGASILWARRARTMAARKRRAHGESFVDPEYDRGAAMLVNRLEDDKRRAAEDQVRNRRA